MPDQAAELRSLVRHRATETSGASKAPRKLVVSAGKGGVGTTTVAVNIAMALARLGWRTILCDADLGGADATWLCGVEGRHSIADVLSGRRTVHEVLQPGPNGIQVVPGVWSPSAVPDCSPNAQERLLRELDQLGRHAEWIVVDAGSGLNHVVRRFWQAADRLLLVTTPEAVSIMDAYAAVKLSVAEQPRVPVHTMVNQAPNDEVALAVHARLAEAAQRFLGLTLQTAGSLPWDSAIALAAAAARPLGFEGTDSSAASAIRVLAETVLAADAAGNTASMETDGEQTRETASEQQAAAKKAAMTSPKRLAA